MLTDAKELAQCSAEERRLRCELADFYHVIDYMGWTELIFNHVSVRLPGPSHHYLVNPFGLNYVEVSPESPLKVDIAGELAERSGHRAIPAAFALHGVIHEHRADVACVGHTHTMAVAVAARSPTIFASAAAMTCRTLAATSAWRASPLRPPCAA